MRKIIAIGESVLDTLYRHGTPVKAMVGGRIANATASLGMTGAPVTFCSECCTDSVGDIIVNFLSSHHVDTKSIDRYTDGSTQLSAIFLAESEGEPDKIVNYGVYPEGGDRFDVVWPRIDEGDIVLFGSLYAIAQPQRERVYELLSYAAERKAVMVYLPGFQHGINFRITRVLTAILENFELSSVIVAHERDLADIFPGESAEKAYHNHIEYYCPCFIHIAADGTVSAFVEKEKWQFQCPATISANWLGWQSGFAAGVICGLIAEGVRAEQMRAIDADTMRHIVDTAFTLAQDASGDTNCITSPMAEKMRQAMSEAQAEEQ